MLHQTTKQHRNIIENQLIMSREIHVLTILKRQDKVKI